MNILHHSKIYKAIAANAISYEAQYRKDTIAKVFLNVIWIGMLFVLIEIIFANTEALAGWSKQSMYLLMIFWMLIDEIDIAFFNEIKSIPDYVTDGSFDKMLVKPANTLFLTTVNLRMKALYRLASELAAFVFVIIRFDFSFSPLQILFGALLFFCGVIVMYSLRLILNTLAFWFYRISNINDLFYMVQSIGQYPLDILPRTLRILFLTLIPIGLTAYVPALAAFGKAPALLIIYTILFTAFLFFIATRFWRIAIKRYSSASS